MNWEKPTLEIIRIEETEFNFFPNLTPPPISG
jgi:hypothetical protein